MTILHNPKDFKVVEFYYYPTCVTHRIVEFDNGFNVNSPDNVEDVKDLFEELLKVVKKKTKINDYHLMNNKVAMKIIHTPTNTTFYIGFKDWNWSLGLALNPYMVGKCIKID